MNVYTHKLIYSVLNEKSKSMEHDTSYIINSSLLNITYTRYNLFFPSIFNYIFFIQCLHHENYYISFYSFIPKLKFYSIFFLFSFFCFYNIFIQTKNSFITLYMQFSNCPLGKSVVDSNTKISSRILRWNKSSA